MLAAPRVRRQRAEEQPLAALKHDVCPRNTVSTVQARLHVRLKRVERRWNEAGGGDERRVAARRVRRAIGSAVPYGCSPEYGACRQSA